ncbi:hypothetical protein OSTOST_16363, partial [Ostertagia ostertagi]
SCSYDPSCPPPQILFRLHAETANSPPFACLNDLKKGVNLVSLNGSSGDVESSASFDVAASDGELINCVCISSRSLPPSSLIIGVSFGDVAERVSADARAALARSFGAVKVARLARSFVICNFGSAWITATCIRSCKLIKHLVIRLAAIPSNFAHLQST